MSSILYNAEVDCSDLTNKNYKSLAIDETKYREDSSKSKNLTLIFMGLIILLAIATIISLYFLIKHQENIDKKYSVIINAEYFTTKINENIRIMKEDIKEDEYDAEIGDEIVNLQNNTYTFSFPGYHKISLKFINPPDFSSLFFNLKRLYSIKFIKGVLNPNNTSLKRMFMHCSNLEEVNLNKFNTTGATSLEQMFANCENLENVKLEGEFNTGDVVNMEGVFYECKELRKVNLGGFNTSNVKSFNSFLRNCYKLEYVNLSSFDTINVENYEYMFNGNTIISSLDLSGFNTENAVNLKSMFSYCSNLTSLNLSSFTTSKVQHFDDLFSNCENLRLVNLSSFSFKNDSSYERIFEGTKNLEYVDLRNYKDNSQNLSFDKSSVRAVCLNERYAKKEIEYIKEKYENISVECR